MKQDAARKKDTAGKKAKDTRIVIRVESDGRLIVDPGRDNKCYGTRGEGKNAEACACRNRKVEWSSDPEDLEWRVEFPEGTPFDKGESVFSSRGDRSAKIKGEPDRKEYKYDIYYERGGETIKVDPKIVIYDAHG